MKIFDMTRNSGKTTRCILELAKNPKAVMIVANDYAKKMVINENKGVISIGCRVFTPCEIDNISRYHEDFYIIVDELDHVLSNIIKHNIKFGTITTCDNIT